MKVPKYKSDPRMHARQAGDAAGQISVMPSYLIFLILSRGHAGESPGTTCLK